MFRPYKAILASLVFLCLICIIIIQVKAQGSPIESEILPSQGNASTTILIRFSTKDATIGDVDKADIFWDNSTIALNQQGVRGADGSYNYNLTVPTQPPLSDIGNHTIRVDSNVFNYGQVSFNFNFTITEFVPSPEYIALNATYYSLLANYTALLDNYNLLFDNYSRISADYAALLSNQTLLQLNYNSLSSSYTSLVANYNSLSTNYNSLYTNYNNLDRSIESLSSNYSALIEDYNSLNSSYSGLESDYDAVLGQSAFSRNLNYVFITSTIALAVTSAYFATRKPKSVSKTRG